MSIHRPSLDERSVEHALTAMSAGQSLGDHPLRFFVSVLARLHSPHVLTGDVAVQIAVFDHLAVLITNRRDTLRHQFRLGPADCEHFATGLQQDFRLGNTDLEAWSVLYHRYVCIDQNLTMPRIASLVHQDERTLRRRHRLGLTRLTRELIQQEQATRRAETAQRLRLALPRVHLPPLFGAEAALSATTQALTNGDLPRHVLLHGPPGIGKTMLALAASHAILDHLDDLLWLDLEREPANPSALITHIVAQLGLPLVSDSSAGQTLRAYLYTHHVLIALDHAEALFEEHEQAIAILTLLESAQVLITSRVRSAVPSWVYEIPVPPLSRGDALSFLDHLAARNPHPSNLLDHFDAIWTVARGNPLALELLARASNALPISPATSVLKVLTHVYDQLWEALSPDERRLWLVPLAYPPDGAAFDDMRDLAGLDSQAADHGLEHLVNQALLETHLDDGVIRYGLYGISTSYLIEHINQGAMITPDESARDYFMHALAQRVVQLAAEPEANAALLVLKLADELGFPWDMVVGYARALALQITTAGMWHPWLARLDRLASREDSAPDAWLTAQLGVAQRWLGNLPVAREHLEHALDDLPVDSADRADALVELAVVYRYQTEWEVARNHLNEAMAIYEALEQPMGTERCVQELGQLALEAHEPMEALQWLSRLSWSARAWSIASQVYLLLEEYKEALHAARQALYLLPAQHANHGRALATMGQVHAYLGQADHAIDYLLLAVELLEQARDMLGMARASNNLAVAYLRQESRRRSASPEDIHRLLVRAWNIQIHIGDEIGLTVTQQNLNWLQSVYGLKPPY